MTSDLAIAVGGSRGERAPPWWRRRRRRIEEAPTNGIAVAPFEVSNGTKHDLGVAEPKTKTKPKPKLARPRVYKVLLHNDDYTPMEFVVLILREVFNKSDADAVSIMLRPAFTASRSPKPRCSRRWRWPTRPGFRSCARWSRRTRRSSGDFSR